MLFTSVMVFSQLKTKQINKKLSKYSYETYTKVKENKIEYRHGEYTKFEFNTPVVKGFYDKGLKQGKWTTKTKNFLNEEYFVDGQLDSFYGENNNQIVSIKYDHQGNQLSKYFYYSEFQNVRLKKSDDSWFFCRIADQGFILNDTLIKGALKNDKKEGIWFFKNSDGSYAFMNFVNNVKIGLQNSHYADGSLYATDFYDDKGKKVNRFVRYQNGDTLLSEQYQNGKLHGFSVGKRANGTTFFSAEYIENRLWNYNEFDKKNVLNEKSSVKNGEGVLTSYQLIDSILIIESITEISGGLPHGYRTYFENEKLKSTEYFKNGIFFKRDDNHQNPSFMVHSEDTVFVRVNYSKCFIQRGDFAKFEPNEDALLRFIANKMDYPEMAIENGAQGIVQLSFTVTELGGVKDVKCVNKKIGYGLEEEAKRVLKLTYGKWTPRYDFGLVYQTKLILPYKFQLL